MYRSELTVSQENSLSNVDPKKLYWLSGCLAGLGCTMMAVSAVGLMLL